MFSLFSAIKFSGGEQKNKFFELNSGKKQSKWCVCPSYANLYHYAANNPIKYIDPDGREDYDSTITQEQFNSIAFRISVNEDGKKKILTWDEIQEFFKQNPNGWISRNPDELMYVLYTDKSKVQEYNMLTNDLLDIYLIGKGICKLVGNTVKKVLAKQAAKQTAKQAVKSTGRTIAKNLTEQLAMEQVKSSPQKVEF